MFKLPKTIKTVLDIVLLLGMLVGGVLLGKFWWHDTPQNEIIGEITQELRNQRLGLCKIPQTDYERAMATNYFGDNFSIIISKITVVDESPHGTNKSARN